MGEAFAVSVPSGFLGLTKKFRTRTSFVPVNASLRSPRSFSSGAEVRLLVPLEFVGRQRKATPRPKESRPLVRWFGPRVRGASDEQQRLDEPRILREICANVYDAREPPEPWTAGERLSACTRSRQRPHYAELADLPARADRGVPRGGELLFSSRASSWSWCLGVPPTIGGCRASSVHARCQAAAHGGRGDKPSAAPVLRRAMPCCGFAPPLMRSPELEVWAYGHSRR